MFFVFSGYVTEKLFYIRVIEFIEEVFLFFDPEYYNKLGGHFLNYRKRANV
ncbi:hypothetical protein SAMN04488505_10275 [Chitinophaga rupis]|uniref:Uncharacterized protein n=1 Tax=Chitinophaga rupis TaxID=573321 RepID=A0A1H7PFU4_9BACT|nr:hypothetical protein SAMN04488505_10275 [Chitinophaga rupis]